MTRKALAARRKNIKKAIAARWRGHRRAHHRRSR